MAMNALIIVRLTFATIRKNTGMKGLSSNFACPICCGLVHGLGAKPPKMSQLAPVVKHTDQESACAKFSNFVIVSVV